MHNLWRPVHRPKLCRMFGVWVVDKTEGCLFIHIRAAIEWCIAQNERDGVAAGKFLQ